VTRRCFAARAFVKKRSSAFSGARCVDRLASRGVADRPRDDIREQG
jgi:hypothetical protein